MTTQAQATQGTIDTGDGGRTSRQDRAAVARHTAWLLHSLGDAPGKVADSLASAGVQGTPADARQCALAMYLRAVMGGDNRVQTVRVFHDRVVVGAAGRFGQRRILVPLTAAARAFVAGFDAQRYPALVRRPAAKHAARGLAATAAATAAPSGAGAQTSAS